MKVALPIHPRFFGGFVLLVLLVAIALYGGYRNLRSSMLESLNDTIDERIAGTRRELVAVRQLYLERVQSAMRLLKYLAAVKGPATAGSHVRIGDRAVPDIHFGLDSTAQKFELVDQTVALLGGTATIFSRDGDDYVRISTNVQTQNGTRAVGTILDPNGPAIASIQRGEAYYGVVDILGRPYITGYEPIRDATNHVIGVYYVGYLVENLDQIGEHIAASRLLQNGFFALLDQRHHPLFHPTAAAPEHFATAAKHLEKNEVTWIDGRWIWRAERFREWPLTLLVALDQSDVKQLTWGRALPVFGLMTPVLVAALLLGYVLARRLERALQQAEKLREEARKLALVASRTHNGVLITGSTGQIEWINEAFTLLTGYTPEEVIGRHPDDFLMGPDTSPATLLEKKKARDERRGFQLEILNYHKSGKPIWLLADGQPVLDEKGDVAQYVVIQVDISKRKQAEEDLRIAREAAEEANRTKSTFLANMSHELRTPMNAIIGYSEMLQEEAADAGQEAFIPDLKKIHSAGQHLLGLINGVLDLSKIEAGKMSVYLEEFSVPTMINEVSGTIQPLMDKNRNQLVVQCSPVFGTMRADVTKVRQTLFNLLSNAAKFTQNGSIELGVTRESRDGSEWVIFRVSDTGIGMTPQQLGKLFQSFAQADASTTRKFGGTGLGLAISRRFCQMMGGDITVGSEAGKGTTFVASIPAEVAEPASATRSPFAPTAASNVTSSTPANPSAPIILVIDDDSTVLEMLTRVLVREGYDVRTAANGRDALILARALRPALITLDVMMPSMDGWSVLTALKSDPVIQAIPVVMISIIDDKQLGFALGAADYLTKPIDRNRLVGILQRHVSREQSRTALVIDDLSENRALLRRTLESEGWTVAEAENGRDGLTRFEQVHPALILLDLMMPVMDGFEFLRDLRGREDGRNVPVVIVTAKELTPAERDQLRAGVENIVQTGTMSHGQLLEEIRANLPSPPGHSLRVPGAS